MKILFVISSLGTGGSERVLVTLANYLVKKYEITIVLLSTDTIFYDIDSNVKVISLNLSKSAKSFIDGLSNNFNRIKVLSKTIKKENPDIIISFLTRTNILSIVASKLVGKKIIVSERSNYNFLKSKVWRFLRRAVYPFADGLIVQSKYDKSKYDFHKNCQIIYNPLFIKNSKKNNFFKKKHIILGVGRIDYNKGFDRLLKAYSTIDTDWKLIIVGEGEERKNLQDLIKKLNLENKVFLIGRKKILKIIIEGHLFLYYLQEWKVFPTFWLKLWDMAVPVLHLIA
nr:glycosyltransferase [Nitrosophilus alvini]